MDVESISREPIGCNPAISTGKVEWGLSGYLNSISQRELKLIQILN